VRRTKRKSDRLTGRRAKKPDLGTEASVSAQPDASDVPASVLDQLRKDKQLRRIHDVSNEEMDMLSRLVIFGCDLGPIHSLRDLIYMLKTIRHAVGR
jgi:hypothetical protein